MSDQALVAAVIGAGLSYVALQQWVLARRKLKWDAFKDRFELYRATRSFINSIIEEHSITQEQYDKFFHTVAPSYFLFEKDIRQYHDLLGEKAQELGVYAIGANADPDGISVQMYEMTTDRANTLIWFSDQLKDYRLEKKFEKYLSVKDL